MSRSKGKGNNPLGILVSGREARRRVEHGRGVRSAPPPTILGQMRVSLSVPWRTKP